MPLTPYLLSMRKTLYAFLLASLALTGLSPIPVKAADLMQSLADKKRSLLLFAKSRSDARLDRQIDQLRDFRSLLDDRDMVVLRITGNNEVQPAIGYLPVPSGSARILRKRFAPDSKGLTVVLVGKDGTEKGRWQNVVDPLVLFDLIDEMPMRKEEVRKEEIRQQQVVN